MTERHLPPIVGEYYFREAVGRRQRDRLVEDVVEASKGLAGFVDLEIPSVVVCPACAPIAPGDFDAAKLRLHTSLQALEEHDGKGEADAR